MNTTSKPLGFYNRYPKDEPVFTALTETFGSRLESLTHSQRQEALVLVSLAELLGSVAGAADL